MAYFKHIFLLAFFILIQSKEIKNQNQQLFIEYDFYYYQYVGEYKIESLTGTNSNLQTIVRNFNLQTAPGVVENITEKKFLYKNLTDQTCIYDEVYLKHIVHEKLNTMKWDMTGNSKEFLGYNCREAKTSWRGRIYIAYFTTELPFKSAPWKFHNLPGVLLKVYTEDEKFNISATSIRIGVDLGIIANPFKFKNSIGWEQHCEEYKASQKRSIERLKVLNIKNGYNITYGGGRIELFTDADIKYDQNSENQKK